MSSFTRTIQRRALRKSVNYEPKAQVTRMMGEGYITLHPTKGWRAFSGKRLAAQQRLAEMLDHFIPSRSRRPAKVWRVPAPVPPPTDTRQQRRARQRGAQ